VKQIDIIKLFDCNDIIQNKLKHLSLIHEYPSSALFAFENFTNFHQKENLVEVLKRQAFTTGTTLFIKSTKKPTPSNNTYQIILICKHYGVPKRNKNQEKQFSDGKAQAHYTIIEAQHSTKSVCTKSRSANLKRATETSQTSNTGSNVTKSNKSTTNRCLCKFSLTIFYDYASSQWFLKKKRYLQKDLITPIIFGLVQST
jgi:hypothetical protein